MLYPYKCQCGVETTLRRPIADRDNPVVCDCGEAMKRQICMPQVCCWPTHLLDENKRPFGLSDKELLAQAKADDKQYERNATAPITPIDDPGDSDDDA